MLTSLLKKLAPVAAIIAASASAGCDGLDISIGDDDGVPLAELDMGGDPPTGIVLASPDTVIVTEGSEASE